MSKLMLSGSVSCVDLFGLTFVAVTPIPETKGNSHRGIRVLSASFRDRCCALEDTVKVPFHLGRCPLELVGVKVCTGVDLDIGVHSVSVVDFMTRLNLVVKVGLHVGRILSNDLKVDFVSRDRRDQDERGNRTRDLGGSLETSLDRTVLHPARGMDCASNSTAGLGVLLDPIELQK